MKKLLIALLAVPVLATAAAAHAWDGYHGHGDWDHHGHGYGHGAWHGPYFGVQIGLPLAWPRAYYGVPAYPYPYSYPFPVTQVVVERQPQVYVQREPVPPAPRQSDSYWYYCPDSKTYYPYVQTCPSQWLQVVPQTSPQEAR